MKQFFLSAFFAVIALYGFAQPTNDLLADAIELPHNAQWQSDDAVYTNVNANYDGAAGCGYGDGNVWFKFQAVTSEIDIRLLTTGSKGTLLAPLISLYNQSLGQPLGCYVNNVPVAYIQTLSLIPGNWYYFSVDSHTTGQEGTFSLSIKNQLNNDFRLKALVIPHTNSWTSADAAFTTINSTFDGGSTTCGYGQGNLWFKFQATTAQIDVRALTGGQKGNLTTPIISLFAEGSTTAITCFRNSPSTVYIQNTTLVPGDWYYISVDSWVEGGVQGTFTLQARNMIGYDLKSEAETVQHLNEWCSESGEYSTIGSTTDGLSGGNCPLYVDNVWFKFKATSPNISISLTPENMTLPYIHLLDANNTILKCETVGSGNVVLEFNQLVKDQIYFVSVGTNAGIKGTFGICMSGGTSPLPSSLCEYVYCTTEGGVGIGTPEVPIGYRMAVNGKIIAEGVKVELKSKWPDYVFDEGYLLKELSEVKKYINEHRHLPEVPSAAAIEKDGIDLGEMNALLLKKMEEMTLYIIKLEERVKELENRDTKMPR
jgi:hypothetical protein